MFDHSNDDLLIFRLFSMRGVSPDGRNTVQGTFDDLSEEEKTRAYLQFLQYHQQLEQENETKKFQQMLNQGNLLRGKSCKKFKNILLNCPIQPKKYNF